MSIKRKKAIADPPRVKYCSDCERAGQGMYCTGRCDNPKVPPLKKKR